MKRTLRTLGCCALALGQAFAQAPLASCAGSDVFEFLEEEAKVVTASRLPQTQSLAPATVYVVTGEDIKASGALNIWDLLRTVPGVDVMATGTAQGEVSIRGLNKPLSNRVLVLMDGRTVADNFFDSVVWESIPVTMAEIERIEVVEGPASALYGPNAVNGVINIITKTPEQLKGGEVSYTGGERNTQVGSAVYGAKSGALGYKLDVGWDSSDQFGNAAHQATAARKVHGYAAYDLAQDTKLSLDAGLSQTDTLYSIGNIGNGIAVGPHSFVRADLTRANTHFRAFWNNTSVTENDLGAFAQPSFNENTYDLNLDQAVALPYGNSLVVGGNYRKNTLSSSVFPPGLMTQDLWGLFFEDQWRPVEHWSAVASGRLDRHPLTPLVFSPRGSVIFDPVPQHVFKFSAGSSFRNPTFLENYLDYTASSPGLISSLKGNQKLDPERMLQFELTHNGTFGRLKTTASGFQYRLKNIINSGPISLVSFPPPHTLSSVVNSGSVSAWGGEFGAEYAVSKSLNTFANYSYQDIKGTFEPIVSDHGGPKHKVNGGLRVGAGGLTASISADWVDKTYWNASAYGLPPVYQKVSDYTLINAHASYRFPGAWSGLEAGVSVFNLAGRDHYEILPPQDPLHPGQNGGIIGQRWTGTLAYKF